MEELVTTTETTLITTELNEIETTTADLSALSEIDVDLLNNFLYLGTSFIIACLFWFVCKWLYKLLRLSDIIQNVMPEFKPP